MSSTQTRTVSVAIASCFLAGAFALACGSDATSGPSTSNGAPDAGPDAPGPGPGPTEPVPDAGSDAKPVPEPLPSSTCAARFGDAAEQTVRDVAVDAQGAVVLVGSFRGRLDFGDGKVLERPDHARGAFLVKLDGNCKPLFAKSFTDEGSTPLLSTATDAEGNIFVLSRDLDLATDTLSVDGSNVRISKLGPTGDLIWSKTLASGSFFSVAFHADSFSRVRAAADGRMVVTFPSGGIKLANGVTVPEKNDAILGVGANGEITWSTSVPNMFWYPAIAIDATSGEVALQGTCEGPITLADGPHPCTDGYLTKLSATGAPLWFHALPIDRSAVAIDGNGDVIAFNRAFVEYNLGSFPVKSNTPAFLGAYVLAKVDGKTGNGKWAVGARDASMMADGPIGLTADRRGELWITASSWFDFVPTTGPDVREAGIYAAHLTADGKHIASGLFGDHGADRPTVALPAVTAAGELILAGGLKGRADFGGGRTLASAFSMSSDLFLVRSPTLGAPPVAQQKFVPLAEEKITGFPDVSELSAGGAGIFASSGFPDYSLFACPLAGCAGPATPLAKIEVLDILVGDAAAYVAGIQDNKGVVLRCTTAGCTAATPVDASFPPYRNAVAIDATSLYFVFGGRVFSCPLAGCGASSPVQLGQGDQIALGGTTLYLAHQSQSGRGRELTTCPVTGCPPPGLGTKYLKASEGLYRFTATATDVFWDDFEGVWHCSGAAPCQSGASFAGTSDLVKGGIIDGKAYFIASPASQTWVLASCPATGCPAGGPTLHGTLQPGPAAIVGAFIYHRGSTGVVRSPR